MSVNRVRINDPIFVVKLEKLLGYKLSEDQLQQGEVKVSWIVVRKLEKLIGYSLFSRVLKNFEWVKIPKVLFPYDLMSDEALVALEKYESVFREKFQSLGSDGNSWVSRQVEDPDNVDYGPAIRRKRNA